MMIRDAKEKDIPRILELLKQVLQIHADIRPAVLKATGITATAGKEYAKKRITVI